MKEHQKHIQCDRLATQQEAADSGEDLFKLREFYDNYHEFDPERNYNIFCVNYNKFFDNIEEFNRVLELEDDETLYPVKIEKGSMRESAMNAKFAKIYAEWIEEMDSAPFIEII